jgi:hypothetical protein
MNWANNRNFDISPNDIVDVPNGDTDYMGDVEQFNNQRQARHHRREQIAKVMWNNYVMHMRSRN